MKRSLHLVFFVVASGIVMAEADAAPPAAAGRATTRETPIPFVRPELPRVSVDTSLPQQRGSVTTVPAGGDLQAAVNAAKPGDTLVLAAGATYRGPILLPKKSGQGWIVITTSAGEKLPPPGTRVTPQNAPLLPKIVTMSNGDPAVRAQDGSHHYRFVGVEFTAAPQVNKVSAIVELHHQGKNLEDVPDQFIFDRVYIHGNPQLNSQRGIALNTRAAAVIDSWIDQCHIHGADSQGIGVWDGPGPFKIVNNFIEGGAENIMFGGAKNSAESMVASDIEIRRNHLYKNPAWFGLKYPDNWVIKNLFEIKTARRVLFEGNVLENCWAEGQTGFAFVLKSSAPEQGQPWDTTSDLTIRFNRIINSLNGVAIVRWASEGPVVPGAEPTSRILFEQNVFERFGAESDWAKKIDSAGILFQVAGRDITLRHNTGWSNYTLLSVTNEGSDNFVFTDNLITPGSYALHPDGAGGGWKGGLAKHIRGKSFMEGNTIIREGDERARQTSPKDYPTGNRWFDSFAAAGVDPKTHRLLPGSKAAGSATDGSDPGADVEAVMKATDGVRADVPAGPAAAPHQ